MSDLTSTTDLALSPYFARHLEEDGDRWRNLAISLRTVLGDLMDAIEDDAETNRHQRVHKDNRTLWNTAQRLIDETDEMEN